MKKEKDFFFQLWLYIYTALCIVCPVVSTAEIQTDKCHKTFLENEDESYELMSYEEAKEFVREINIKTRRDFFEFALSKDRPEYLPLKPSRVYKEWTSWEDFLGVENAGEKQAPAVKKENAFLEDLKIILSNIDRETEGLGLNDQNQKKKTVIKSSNTKGKVSLRRNSSPKNNGATNSNWMSYESAKKLIQSLGITTTRQFNEWSKKNRPPDFPSNPYSAYKKEWRGWGDFLGTGRIITKNWMSYEEAKAFIQSEGITSESSYRRWRKKGLRPLNFPANPDRGYKEHWRGWREFLGTNKEVAHIKMKDAKK